MADPIVRELLPDSTVLSSEATSIGGCDLIELASEHGTPLFVYDEQHIRDRCREAVTAFGDGVAYATKAFLCSAMARLAWEEGMHLDVATGGELFVAGMAGFPADRLVLHGNNKSVAELEMALQRGVGRIVIDSFAEIERLEALVGRGARRPRVLVRVNPGVDAHTHEYLKTGTADSKFGFGLHSGEAARAVALAAASLSMELVGLHVHIGSQVFDATSFSRAIAEIGPFVAPLGLPELSIGGGLGVPYVEGERAPSITEWAEIVKAACAGHGITSRVLAEPGRAIVASAAVTLYTVGTIKEIPGVRTYLAVDGGMSDNPRPVLYGSGYEAFLPRSPMAARERRVRVVGKHCESGDVVISDAAVPPDIAIGDVLATPVTGAYGHSMGSNYNMILRPAVVFVAGGEARLVVRRERYNDLVTRDV